MTEQTPSDEAKALAYDTIGYYLEPFLHDSITPAAKDELRDIIAAALDRFAGQRVATETERWQNRDRQRLEQISNLQETVQSLQNTSAERPAPPQRHLTGGEREVLHKALLASSTPVHSGDAKQAALASTGEQPDCGWVLVPREPTEEMLGAGDSMMPQIAPGEDITTGYDALAEAWPAMIAARPVPPSPSAVVDYTERARLVLDRWCGSHLYHFIPVDPSKREDPAAYLELHDLITDALSAVAEATAMRAFGQRVWSDTEEVAYQAGVSDTRARLQEPDVRGAVKAALEQGRPHWITGVGPGGSGLGGMADAAIARIVGMLK